MKVAICIPNLTGGGAETQVEYLLSGLVEREYDLTLLYLRHGPGKSKYLDGVHYICLGDIRKISIFIQLFIVLWKQKFDVVISASLFFDILIGLIRHFLNINLIIRESNSIEARKYSGKNKIRMLVNKNTYIISNNESGLDMWKKQGNNGILIKNGYNLLEQSIDGKLRSGILIGGRFIQRKRILEAIQFASRHPQLADEKITVFGDGKEKENILETLGNQRKDINFVGFIPQSEVLNLMGASRYFISLSDYEGTPNVVLEALSHGCEVILSDVPSHRDYFPQSIVNYVPSNPFAQSACVFVTTDPHKRHEFCNSWSKDKMVKRYAEIIDNYR